MARRSLGINKYFYRPNTRLMIIPSLYLIVISLLLVISFRVGISKIYGQNQSLSSLKKTNNILSEKESTLKTAQPLISAYLVTSDIALPSGNPALLSLTQIKKLTGDYLVPLQELKVSNLGSGGSASSSVAISLKTSGDIAQIIAFIKAIGQIAPVTQLDRLGITSVDNIVSVDIKIRSFWGEVPLKLSNVTDPISKINDTDINNLKMMSQLMQPTFYNLLPSGTSTRTSPFN